MSYDTTNKIQQNWIKRAENESDPFNKFISYWIAFNCWYGSRYGLKTDRQSINKIKQEIEESILKIVFEDAFIKELNKLRLRNVRTTLLHGRNQIVRVREFKDVIEWVYIARNNLFHGNKLDSEERDSLIIKNAIKIMKEITSEILVKKF